MPHPEEAPPGAVSKGESGGDDTISRSTALRAAAGCTAGYARRTAESLEIETVPLDKELALDAAALRETTRSHGLSLGERAALALAKREGSPVLTTDQAWAGLDIGVEVRLIRGE